MSLHIARYAAFVLAVPTVAVAQARIEWWSVDGGGGTSNGGTYTLSGTIGQPDAEVVSLCSADGGAGCVNAAWSITGGFWVGAAGASEPGCESGGDCLFRDGFEEDSP